MAKWNCALFCRFGNRLHFMCITVITVPIQRMEKVLFSQVCVCPHGGGGTSARTRTTHLARTPPPSQDQDRDRVHPYQLVSTRIGYPLPTPPCPTPGQDRKTFLLVLWVCFENYGSWVITDSCAENVWAGVFGNASYNERFGIKFQKLADKSSTGTNKKKVCWTILT